MSGEAKVSAKLGGGFNLFGNKATAEATTEGSGGKSKQTDTHPIELDPADVNDIIDALDAAECPKFVVLEDFHYLPEDTQRDFAVALKAFHEDSPYSFIVVGVWRDQNRLVQQNGDLTGRVRHADVPAQRCASRGRPGPSANGPTRNPLRAGNHGCPPVRAVGA